MKRIAALVVILGYLLLPGEALASMQVIIGDSGGSSASPTVYPLMGSGATIVDGTHANVIPVSGTISALYIYRPTAPGGSDGKTTTLRVNNVNTSLTCDVTGSGHTCSDTTHSVSVNAGDYLTIRLDNIGSPISSEMEWSVVFTPTNSNDTVILGATQNNGNSGRTYLDFYGRAVNNNESSTWLVAPEPGTLDQLATDMPSFTSGSFEFTVFKNSASSTVDCTAGSPTFTGCTDTTHSTSFSVGDTLSLLQTAFSPGASAKVGFGVRFRPSVPGNFDIFSTPGGGNADSAGATRYNRFSGGDTAATTEASSTQVVAGAITISSMTLLRSSAPGSGKSVTYTLRKNGADTGLTCSLSGSGSGVGITTNTCTGSVSFSPGDLVDWTATLDSSGTASKVAIGWSAFPTYSCGFGSPIGKGLCRGYLTSGTSWSVPTDWNSSGATIEAVGPGGNGANGTLGDGSSGGGGGGGQGGGYGKVTSPSNISAGDSLTVQIGSVGSTNATYLEDNTSTIIVQGDYGANGAMGNPGAGGSRTQTNIGDTTFNGGNGNHGTNGSLGRGGGGGGGSAGPNGNGGGGGTAGSSGGGGGGAASGGSAGSNAPGSTGGTGGNNSNGFGGGSGGTSNNAGTAGTAQSPYGGAGGGGGGGSGSVPTLGGAGAIGEEWDSAHGTGGGGGGGGTRSGALQGGSGGAGGAYGAGGGGACGASSSPGTGGSGGGGLLVITYSVLPRVTSDIATAVGASSAILNATLDADKGLGVSEHGFAYSTDSTLTTGVSTTTLGSLSGPTYFNQSINSLSVSTTYYFRAYAINVTGIGYGPIGSFTTGNTVSTSKIRLFGGFKIKFLGGRMILY